VKNFHELTKNKAHGRPRILILDGHQSHLSLPFLLFCKENNIHVLCYPSHTTHIYQGLDVAIFGILKTVFSEEIIKFEEETGVEVCKANFLQVYTPTHIRVFTSENIVKAFSCTGVWPFNPAVINTRL
ncbi:uncharacterized protein FOMMEDRAFT_46485, partial [Fomitiporia mediterranea MF3/22]|uniref:uncharacterized protein n=1 Tax=Fomitiporia mediterranea (strain MF3/22) TaxID=694068 RepID=UPI0004409A17